MSEALMTVEEFKKEGLIAEEKRPYQSKRMTGFNAQVYSAWIGRWAQNAAVNYPVISESWGNNILKKCAPNVPAVVVGIGPSLDENIDNLKHARGFALIIATDAALRPLLRHGITPDLVMNYDARDQQLTMWESIDTSPFILVANSVTSPRTIDAWKGKQIFFNAIQLDDEFATNILPAMYPHLGGLPNLGTVGNGAIYLAYEMGCAPIITVGMDLCYRMEPQVAGGTDNTIIEKASWRYRCQDYLFAPGNVEFPEGWVQCENKILYDNNARMANTFDVEHKGETFRVDEALRFYANSLLGTIGTVDIPVINCSGGVLSKYVRSMTLADALKNKCAKRLYPGQTLVRFLRDSLPNGKAGRSFDGKYWRDGAAR